MANNVVAFSLKDAPALIEKLLPVQRLSPEVYKERMAGASQTLTSLGGFWKGRKPLILNKACILGSLLPATDNLQRDLEVFEKLMAMDSCSLAIRLNIKPNDIVSKVSIKDIYCYFDTVPPNSLPSCSPFDPKNYPTTDGKIPKIYWREDISEEKKGVLSALALPDEPYREMVSRAKRPEELDDSLYLHIWNDINKHLGTNAFSFEELVEQLGIMRFGHRPRVGDTFAGSGQIPFEAARLGCDVYASDLNPIACMLTWGNFNIIGASSTTRARLLDSQKKITQSVQLELDRLKIESDGNGWVSKVYLYCVEALCSQSGWMVPLMPSLVVSKGYRVIAQLVPNFAMKRYDIKIKSEVSDNELIEAEFGTIRSDGKGQEPYLIHCVGGKEYRTKISTLRGDYVDQGGYVRNALRLWEREEIKPRPNDIYQERLYAIQWTRPSKSGKGEQYEFRSVTEDDLKREKIVEEYIAENLQEWQRQGWLPDMRIESGVKTDEPIRTRGWTYWHHLFNPRQLLLHGLIRQNNAEDMPFSLGQILNVNSRCSRWNPAPGPGRAGKTSSVFDNQAINTLFNYGCRGLSAISPLLQPKYRSFPLSSGIKTIVQAQPAELLNCENDIYITDPPYGDAVKYEEILEFFIAWLRRNPPSEFASWTWDSRRALAIKGEDEDFRRGMVAAYQRMTEKMANNGLQIIMFTHQSGNIWADMANIVWASGLHVTAAWYVVTETDNALREGSYVKGTVLLVLRKREGSYRTSRSDLAWEIQEEVEEQVQTLTGLNQEAKEIYRDENLFSDADLQMAGYAAALRVLTRYAVIDGQEMASEAVRPRVKGQKTFVDELIGFAVGVANKALVPAGINKTHWHKLQPVERFYLKMIEMEAKGSKSLDNYQNFAKAFNVKNFKSLMASEKANSARLKSASEFGRAEMAGDTELANTILRNVLYALMELEKQMDRLEKETDSNEILAHLSYNLPNYFNQRDTVVEVSDYLAKHLEVIRPQEASAARILSTLVRNQKLG